MRIAFELTALQLDTGGTARAIEQTLPLLAADARVDLVTLEQPGRVPTGRAGIVARGLSRELWYLPRVLPRNVAKSGAELLHCPSQLVPKRSPVPLVMTLHDAIGWDHPEWLTRANVHQLTTRVPRALDTGAQVITSSNYSRERLIEALQLDAERVTTIPLGLDPRFSADPDPRDAERRAALGVAGDYLLTVGTLQPRKNLEAVLAAFEQVEDDHLTLAIAGARGWHDEELLARIERSPAGGRIVLLGRVTDDDLLALYRGAECFVFPSKYEGFGFPPLEAMACGTPVLSSTRTSLAEAVGDAAIEIDPDDPAQIAEQIARVIADASLRARLVEDGCRQAARFTWERCVDETIALYQRVIERAA